MNSLVALAGTSALFIIFFLMYVRHIARYGSLVSPIIVAVCALAAQGCAIWAVSAGMLKDSVIQGLILGALGTASITWFLLGWAVAQAKKRQRVAK